jgi:hypothetical protein
MPDANVDLSSVGTPDDNSVTLAKMAGGTDGNLITYDASGDPAYVTTGTSGQVLTSGGTGVAPTFQAAAAGGATDIDGLSDGTTTSTTIALGSGAGTYTGTSCTLIGVDAGKGSAAYAQENTAVGYQALYSLAGSSPDAIENTGVGAMNLTDLTSGRSNSALGRHTARYVTTGDYNVGLGFRALDTSSPSGSVTTASGIACIGNNSVTDLYCADTTISSSDQRDKTDIEDFSAGLDFVKKMRPITYRWDKRTDYVGEDATSQDVLDATPDGTHKRPKKHLGFLSQEVEVLEQEIGFSNNKLDQLVCNTNEDDTAMGIKYERLIPILVNAIKELSVEIDTLKGV